MTVEELYESFSDEQKERLWCVINLLDVWDIYKEKLLKKINKQRGLK